MSALAQLTGSAHLSRARQGARRLRRQGRLVGARALLTMRRWPVPTRVRRPISALVLWRRRDEVVPVDRLLLGGQSTLSGTEFAVLSCDLGWPSRKVIDGPHADLLRRASARPLSDEELLGTPYGRMARDAIAFTGRYFAARDDSEVVRVARRFLDGIGGVAAASDPMPHQTPVGDPIRVAPVRSSDCYQVIDGHHRVAACAVSGAETVSVRVKRVAVSTPLQDLLEQMSWTGGTRELYQPIEAPELETGWTQVRRCTDRLDKMVRVLDRLALPQDAGYLDVASCYGWFVDRLTRLGFDGAGVERDRAAPLIGTLAYGLDPARITVADAEAFLSRADRTWEVVSCFSLLHHFALGRARLGAADLVRLLDRVTGRVLFLDTGQAHEAWFRDSLPEWDADHVAAFLTRHGRLRPGRGPRSRRRCRAAL